MTIDVIADAEEIGTFPFLCFCQDFQTGVEGILRTRKAVFGLPRRVFCLFFQNGNEGRKLAFKGIYQKYIIASFEGMRKCFEIFSDVRLLLLFEQK